MGSRIAPEARDLLLARVGADRALSRGEVEKLALYAAGKTEIDVADVEAIVGDASELAIDRILSAAASGDARPRRRRVRARASPPAKARRRSSPRRSAISSGCTASAPTSMPGRSFEDAIRQLRPPVHFKQKDALGLQCRTWTTARLAARHGARRASGEDGAPVGPAGGADRRASC